MAKKLISYDDQKPGLGLPDVVEGKLDMTYAPATGSTVYATKNELANVAVPDNVVTSQTFGNIVATSDPNYVPQPGELVVEYEPPFTAVDNFENGLTGWTPRWRTDVTWVAADNPEAIDGKTVKIAIGGAARASLSWDLVPEDAEDVEILYRTHVVDLSTTNKGGSNIRGSGAAGSETAYRAAIYQRQLALAKFVSGTYSNITNTVPVGLEAGDWAWVRFRVVGNKLSAKAWRDGDIEPVDWTIEAIDDSITGGGWVGPGTSVSSEWDVFAVALDGAKAVIP